MLENNTRKQTWLTLIIALGMWCWVGWALIQPADDGTRPITNVAVLGTYFGTILAVILPIIASAYKSFREKKLLAGQKEQG